MTATSVPPVLPSPVGGTTRTAVPAAAPLPPGAAATPSAPALKTAPIGMRHDGLYVLTEAELRRIVYLETRQLYAEMRRLRGRLRRTPEAKPEPRPYVPYVPKTEFALERRRETYRRATAKRRQRYLELCDRFGVPSVGAWTRHLTELERLARAAA